MTDKGRGDEKNLFYNNFLEGGGEKAIVQVMNHKRVKFTWIRK